MNTTQEDYIKKQINQLGQVLARLLGSILGFKNQGKETEIISLVDKTLKDEMGIDLSGIITIPEDRLIETLKQRGEISNESLDRLADILINIADEEQHEETKKLFLERVMEIFKYLEKNDKTYSFARYQKMKWIKNEKQKNNF